tara:strand:- start:71183 stop:72043 length:861 start_codon:yes stop_codon:yes gene_type:complete
MPIHSGVLVAIGAVAGTLLTFSLMTWGAGTGSPVVGGEGTASSSGARLQPVDAVAIDLQPILDRLDALRRDMQELRDAHRANEPERVAVVHSTPTSVDVESLLVAFDEMARRKLKTMSTDELLASARELRRNGASRMEAMARYEALLQRELDPKLRGDAMIELATMQRSGGTPDSLRASEHTLQAVMDLRGPQSEQGLQAAYQLAWTASAMQDPQRALELARSVAQSPVASKHMRTHGQWAAAMMLEQLGDAQAARTSLQQLLARIETDSSLSALAALVRKRLGQE